MAESDSLVSVVLPTYNRARSVGAAIESVLRQTHTALELLVVDDGSTDDTEQRVRRIGDARISYLRHENNRGGSAARNTGLAAARGRWIAFQDSDDEWLPHKIERQLARLASCGAETGVVYCAYWRELSGGRREFHPADPKRGPSGDIHRALLRRNFIGTPTILARRECVDAVGGFDEGLPRFQDWDWMIRVSKQWQVAYVDEPLVRAGFADDNVTDGHSTALVDAERRILDKHLDSLREAGNDLLAYRLWHLSHVSIMQGDTSGGREALRGALRTRFRFGWACLGLLSLVPPLYRRLYAWTGGARSRRH